MKKIICICLGMMVASACSDQFLDADIAVNRDIASFYQTPNQINGALIDNYNVLQNEMFALSRFVFGDIASDDALKGGESIGDWGDMEQIAEFRPLATNAFVSNLWTNAYRGITKSNIILQKINDVANFGGDMALKNRYIAEAKFLRAFNYYYIAMTFGDAPILTEAITDFADIDATKLERKPVAEIWALIESDLIEAIPNLATKGQLTESNELGRATKGAGQALLSYALMFQRKFDEAVPVLQDLVEKGGYSLLSDYGAIFRPEGEFSSENIFEINFIFSNSGWGDDCEGSIRYVYQMSRDDWGWGFNQPTQDLFDAFEPGDPRLVYTINMPNDEYEAGVLQKNSQNNPYGYHSRKAFQLPSERPASASCGGQNEVIFRLADMYLLYAEALVQASTGKDVNKAMTYVNEVRKRANGTPKVDPERVVQAYAVAAVSLPMIAYTSDAQLLQDIWHERRVELGMEQHRWWDLVRQERTDIMEAYYQNWGIQQGYADKGDLKGKFYTDWITKLGKSVYPVFPVPQGEIDASQGNLEQTVGY